MAWPRACCWRRPSGSRLASGSFVDLRETAYWARRLFPGAVRIAERGVTLPGRRRVKSRPGIPVTVAEFSLYDEPADADEVPEVVDGVDAVGVVGGGEVVEGGAGEPAGGAEAEAAGAGAEARRREVAAFTVDFGRVDVGLRTPGDDDVRVEMFLVAYPDSVGGADSGDDSAMARIVAGAAAVVADDPEAAGPTPGSVIPDAVRIGLDSGPGVPGEGSADDSAGDSVGDPAGQSGFAASGATTPHLLCVVPYVWPDGVPTITEEPGKISLHQEAGGVADAVTGGARLTTVTQLVPITGDEYAHADAHGVDSLMRLLAEADADLRDLRRGSVAQ